MSTDGKPARPSDAYLIELGYHPELGDLDPETYAELARDEQISKEIASGRAYPEPDEATLQPSDALLRPFLEDGTLWGGAKTRSDVSLHTLEWLYWFEQVQLWLETPDNADIVSSDGEYQIASVAELTAEWHDDLAAALPLPALTEDGKQLLAAYDALSERSRGGTGQAERDAVNAEIFRLGAEANPEATKEVRAFKDVLYRHSFLVQRWAWERKGLVYWGQGTYHLKQPLPDHLFTQVFEPSEDLRLSEGPAPETGPPSLPKSLTHRVPSFLPQYTFAELKAIAMASADGPRGRGWTDIPTEIALWHTREKGAPLKIQYNAGPLVQLLGSPATHAALRAELPKMGLAANLALHACVNSLLGSESQATIDIDDLVAASGLEPRSRVDRIAMRSRVWHWLVVFSCWQAIGQRKGTYKDPDTQRIIDLRSEVPLFHIDERTYPTGPGVSLEESHVPLRVAIIRGSWLSRWADNAHVVSYFGNVRKLSALPGGQPSGAWAQAIGMALFQFWREESSRVDIKPVGDERILTPRFKSRTRRELLDLFPPDPTLDEILTGGHPRYALQYYKGAIALLKKADVLGYYQEPPPPTGRQGWGQVWANQEVVARPTHDDTQQVITMASRADAGRKRARRKTISA